MRFFYTSYTCAMLCACFNKILITYKKNFNSVLSNLGKKHLFSFCYSCITLLVLDMVWVHVVNPCYFQVNVLETGQRIILLGAFE